MNTRILIIAAFALLGIVSPSWSRATPFENMPDGCIRHTFSGFVFPTHVGGFQREQMRQYNQVGSDVSAGYNAGVLIAATVYVYPAPSQQAAEVLSREYASKKAEVLHGHHGVAVLSEIPVTITQGGKKHSGKRAYFGYRDIFARTPQDLKSQLLVCHDGSFFVEYRFTYPAVMRSKLNKRSSGSSERGHGADRTPNQSIEPTTSRCTIQLSMTSTRQSAARRAPARGGLCCSR
jgi:hypothetical protein